MGTESTTYPDVTVALIGSDGNAFALIGKVSRALRDTGHADGVSAFQEDASNCESYSALLQLITATVNVI